MALHEFLKRSFSPVSYLFVVLLVCHQSAAQEILSRDAVKNRRQRAVILVNDFANRALSFRDPATRIVSLTRFAGLLWKDDEAHARELFLRALDSCAPKADSSPAELTLLARLRREVLAAIAQKDVSLAKQLAKEDVAGADTTTDIRIAHKLLTTKPDQAVSFAQQSLENGISPDLVFFLLRLRSQNEAAADRLFLDVLGRSSAIKCFDAETLMLLGTYVFTFPPSAGDANVTPTMMKYIGVGPVMLPDLSSERPGIPRPLILAYLEAGANVLSNPVCPAQDRSMLYAAAHVLLNKAATFAPDLTSRIALSMQSLRDGIPAELVEERTFKTVENRAPKTLEDSLSSIESQTGVDVRDAQYFALVFDLWRRSEFEKARMVNGRISDLGVRERLNELILFAEAARAIEKTTKLDESERIVSKMPAGIERALLRLGLASLHAKQKNLVRAEESISASLRDARRLDDSRVPFLMLAAASQLARIDSPDALVVLGEVVRKLNAQKSNAIEELSWDEKVSCGVLWRNWPLEIKGVSNSFSEALPDLLRADTDVAVETVLKLTNENHLSQALLEVAAVVLKDEK